MNRIATFVATNGEPVEIALTVPVDRTVNTLEEQAAIFTSHAANIERVLYASMPGGLYDRLLGVMLERKASHFIVSHR